MPPSQETNKSRLALFLTLAIMGGTRAKYAPCPPGWVQWRQSCYALLPEKMTWFEAARACNRPGSGFVVPNSQEENDFIWNSVFKATYGAWIGCTDAVEEGVWLCGDQPAVFTNWSPGYPSSNNTVRNCARMVTQSPGGRWADNEFCDTIQNPKPSACEMSASAVPVYHTFTGPDGRVFQRCLLNHGIKNLAVEGVVAYGWACRADLRCRSFNLWESGKKKKTCELNDVTRLGADSSDFQATKSCYYFDL